MAPKKLRLSPTRIGTFLTCAMMYKYDYIDRIGRFYHKASAGASFGSTLHQALHDFHLAGGAQSEGAGALAERAMQSWRSAGFADAEQEGQYRDLAVSLLQSYHDREAKRDAARRVFLAEKAISWDMGEFILTGRVDRIDEHIETGALEIVDYKSGRYEVSVEDVEGALGMCVYQLILKRLHPDRRVSATIHALRGNVSATVELTDEQLARWEDDIRGIVRRIIETDWESVRPVYLDEICPNCDFLRICGRWFRKPKQLSEP